MLVLALAAVTVSALGSSRLLWASRSEARGEVLLARRHARMGGFLLAAGCVGQAVSSLFLSVRFGFDALAATSALVAGFTGLLGGLSGKPRPSGPVAVALWVASVLLGLRALGVV